MELLLVGIGGTLGALCRYLLGRAISARTKAAFPLGTFIINISGAIMLGVLVGSGAGKSAYLLLGDGFLGAYTTFSTFMYEDFVLFRDKKKLSALVYIAVTLLIGLSGFYFGFWLVKRF